MVTIALTVLTIGLYFWPGSAGALQFDREALGHGELWRLLTGHLTHFGAGQLQWDLLVFAGLGVWCEWQSRRAFVCCLAAASLAISIGVWILQPQFVVYRGLSGLDMALVGLLIGGLLRRARQEHNVPTLVAGRLALTVVVAKCLYEWLTGQTIFVEALGSFAPVPLAHLIGLAVGLALANMVDFAVHLPYPVLPTEDDRRDEISPEPGVRRRPSREGAKRWGLRCFSGASTPTKDSAY